MFLIINISALLSIFFIHFCTAQEENIYTVAYTKNNFYQEIRKTNHFVMFNAPWFYQSEIMAKAWENLAGKLLTISKIPSIILATVSCFTDRIICENEDVYDLAIHLYKLDGKVIRFSREMDIASIETFVVAQLKEMNYKIPEEINPEKVNSELGTADINNNIFRKNNQEKAPDQNENQPEQTTTKKPTTEAPTTEIDDLPKNDNGPDGRFGILQGQSYEWFNRNYTYYFYPFNKINQQPRYTADEILLGVWKGWDGPSKNKYDAMYYDGGKACENGQLASVRVCMRCSNENTLESVMEPKPCQYLFRFFTPAACQDFNKYEHVKCELHKRVHDDL